MCLQILSDIRKFKLVSWDTYIHFTCSSNSLILFVLNRTHIFTISITSVWFKSKQIHGTSIVNSSNIALFSSVSSAFFGLTESGWEVEPSNNRCRTSSGAFLYVAQIVKHDYVFSACLNVCMSFLRLAMAEYLWDIIGSKSCCWNMFLWCDCTIMW